MQLKNKHNRCFANKYNVWLMVFVLISLAFKLLLIFTQGNNLSLSSDDLNYIKSAVALVKKGIFVFHEYNEPTVFITPSYPVFLALIFKIFGYGFIGLQVARVIQAVLSSVTIALAYLIAKSLFNKETALIASFLVSFYFPNIVTPGYFLTESLFTVLLMLLLYLSMKFSEKPEPSQFIKLGFIWAAATLCRPTIAFYPLLLFFFLFVSKKLTIKNALKLSSAMLLSFLIILSPWWIRNYVEYRTFIPLAESSGNPLLQGTYIGYEQTPENTTYYDLGRNAFETNKIEVEVAKKCIIESFKKDFWRYLKWYTIDKTFLFWGYMFYWKEYAGITIEHVLPFHILILTGFLIIPGLLIKEFRKYVLPISILAYFNAVHCIYMAFDRYAFPLLPILSIFSAAFIFKLWQKTKKVISNIFISK